MKISVIFFKYLKLLLKTPYQKNSKKKKKSIGSLDDFCINVNHTLSMSKYAKEFEALFSELDRTGRSDRENREPG